MSRTSTPAPVAGRPSLATAPVPTESAAAADVAPRPVFCVIEHLHRSRDEADDARAGRFTCAGATLDLGTEPDWLTGGLPDDEEWRIEWSKFYFGLDLAAAYRETGDPGYLEAWEALVTSWVAQVPVDRDPSDVIGRRLQNWVYAWQGFAGSGHPGPSRPTTALLLGSMAAQLDHLRGHLTPERNHRTLELYALLVVALALPRLDPEGELAAFAWEQLQRNLVEDVWPDGVHRECSTHYHLIALRSFLGARENARRFGLAVADGYDERLRLACRFALHVQRPDGRIPALSDSDSEDHTDLLALADRLLDLPELRWAATAGAAGSPSPERGVGFPLGGYFVQRSGWGRPGLYADERFLILDAGPLGDGGHGHYDALSIEAYGLGRPLVVDPGRFTYSEAGPNWRRWFKQTAAHNTVTVDDLDQTPYRRGKAKRDRFARARLLSRIRTDDLDLLRGQVTSPCYDAVHTREVAFVAGEYWIVADDLEAGAAHTYRQRMHLDAGAWERTDVEARDGDIAVRAPGVALLYPQTTTPRLEAGWVSAGYGVKEPAPVVTATRRGDVATDFSAEFLTVLWPRATRDAEPPRLSLKTRAPGTVSLRLDGVGPDRTATDYVAWAPAAIPLRLGPLELSARAAWLRVDRRGTPLRLAVYEGRDLTWSMPGPAPDPFHRGDGWRLLPDPGDNG